MNVSELFATRTRSAGQAVAWGLGNHQDGLRGQNAQTNAYVHDDYSDVRTEAATRVQDELAKVGWATHLSKVENVLKWSWPPETAEAPRG